VPVYGSATRNGSVRTGGGCFPSPEQTLDRRLVGAGGTRAASALLGILHRHRVLAVPEWHARQVVVDHALHLGELTTPEQDGRPAWKAGAGSAQHDERPGGSRYSGGAERTLSSCKQSRGQSLGRAGPAKIRIEGQRFRSVSAAISGVLARGASGSRLQLGGSDQWGNIVAGLDLIRKVEGGSAHAFTIPLMAKSDGSKFGKTAGGSVWLDGEMTSPYAFYQFWINTDDEDVAKYLKVFSFKDRSEIERLIETVKVNPGAREAQRELAREITSLVHGSDECAKVEAASKALFGQGDLKDLDEATLAAALSQLPKISINAGEAIPTWVDLLAATGVVDSKSAARRIVKENGAYLNNEKISGEDFAPTKADLIHGRFFVLRKGKRDLASVELI